VVPELYVHETVLAALSALPARPWEVGGWLIGYWSTDREAVVVTHHTPARSRGTAFGVTISGRGHRKRFDAIFDRTGGHATFLGDWHSHPAGAAEPSQQDLTAMRQLADDANYATPCPLTAIVATGRFRRRLPETRWWLRPADGRVQELAALPYDGPRVNRE
jgi:integrative and conjugative element protein (TIGR02256 family)